MREQLGNQTDTRLAFNLAIVLRIALLLLCSVTTIMAGSQGPKSTRFTSLDFTNSDTISLDLLSPFTLHQTGRGTIPLFTVDGADTDIPLSIRPKGNSFLQLGPDTYGQAGWLGNSLITENVDSNLASNQNYGHYNELYLGDVSDGRLTGYYVSNYTQTNGVNNLHELIGADINAYPLLPAGKTLFQMVGVIGQAESYNYTSAHLGFGVQGFVTSKANSHVDEATAMNSSIASTENGTIDFAKDYQSTFFSISQTSGAGVGIHYLANQLNDMPMQQCYVLYSTDLTGKATDDFYLWFDSPGVYNVKSGGVINTTIRHSRNMS